MNFFTIRSFLSLIAANAMLSRSAVAFLSRAKTTRTIFSGSSLCFAKEGQAEVVLVGCGAPNRGMWLLNSLLNSMLLCKIC